MGRPGLDDPYWAPRESSAALDKVEVPILLVGGWQDLFLPPDARPVRAPARARARRRAHRSGPGPISDGRSAPPGSCRRETLAWLDEHLAGATGRTRPAPVHLRVTGSGGGWCRYGQWPPPTVPHERHLQPGGLLGVTPPAPEDDPVALFRYEPADPTPTVGGRLLAPPGGVQNQRKLESRADVVTFTSEPLTHDVEVQGVPVLEVRHSTDNPHADVFVRLSDVGRTSRNVTDAHLRLDPHRDRDEPLRIPLDPCAHRFAAGHRLRVLIAGGSHPRFARNPGTAQAPLDATSLEGSTHTVHGGTLTLPVVSDPGGSDLRDQTDGSR